MQFNLFALTVAALAAVASAQEIVTVMACPSSSPATSGVASPTVASTGVAVPPTPTGSPIPFATGAASAKGVSALGLIVAGGVALFL